MATILFLHGWHSVPGGVKPTYLVEHGHTVINPKLDDDDFPAAVRTAQEAVDQHRPEVIVGSSRGGAVALSVDPRGARLVLLCPAWKNWGTIRSAPPGTVILHSRADDVIPFAASEELVQVSHLPASALSEVGTDHRLAEPEPLARMLEACEATLETIVGVDFGLPRKAGEQANKIILIEARRLAERHYAIRPAGRNQRLVRWNRGERSWPGGRAGWTLPELHDSLARDSHVSVGAFDFPFGIPQTLLEDVAFAQAMDQGEPFRTRQAWVDFVAERLSLRFSSNQASGEMTDLLRFNGWKAGSQFWKRRATDIAARAQPPLKHKYQNLFAMTLGGVVLLEQLRRAGYSIVLERWPEEHARCLFETYPGLVARQVGYAGSYKKHPQAAMESAQSYLRELGIRLDIAPEVQQFCLSYRTGAKKDDPDGADAFLALIAAVAFREGWREMVTGDASPAQLEHEGVIIVPPTIDKAVPEDSADDTDPKRP